MGISLDDGPATVKKWMSENHAQFRTVVDPKAKAADQFDVHGIPSLVINPSGNVTKLL